MRKNISLTLYYEVYLHGSKLIQNLHDLAAASGDHIARLYMHQLMADGAINVTFFFCPNHTVQAKFQFIFHCIFTFFELFGGFSVHIAVPLYGGEILLRILYYTVIYPVKKHQKKGSRKFCFPLQMQVFQLTGCS